MRLNKDPVTLDFRDSNKSPVHIHLTEDMPVHVHVKKEKKRANVRRKTPSVRFGSGILKTESGFKSDTGVSGTTKQKRISRPCRSELTKSVKVRSGSSANGPSKTKLNRSSSVTKPVDKNDQGTASDYEEYARRSRSSSLRREDRPDQTLEATYRALDEDIREFDEISRDIKLADSVNRKLRRSIEALNRSDADLLLGSTQNDKVQRKLLEVELESEAIANQVSALADTLKFLQEDKRIASQASNILMKHKELLVDRLERFSAGSSALRKLMTYQQDQDVIALKLADQRDKLLERLAKSQNSQQDFMTHLLEKDEEITDLKMQIEAQKEEMITLQGLQTSTSTTKAHLHKQLKQKDGDCNRLSVQIRTLESQLAQERIDVEHLRNLLVQARKKPDEDKEALKKAARVQKLRAARSEDALEQLKTTLLERDSAIEDLKVDLEAVRSHNIKLNREKEQTVADINALKSRLHEVEGLMERQDDRSRHQVATASNRLEEKSAELTALRRDNDKLRAMCASADNKMAQKDEEMAELKANIERYETSIADYRNQLEEQRRETRRARMEGEEELEEVRSRLESRLHELEPLPDHLRNVELRLQSATDEIRAYEHQLNSSSTQIANLQEKMDEQGHQLRASRNKYDEDARASSGKLLGAERRISLLEDENKDLVGSNAKREEAVRQMTARLDEKIRDNASLQRQLDSATSELRRMKELERERSTTTERTLQAKILELESQLGQTRSEVSRLKRDKEDMDRKLNSKLYDMKDRLEQSHSTNRSMQNYVQFLKNSYTSAFNDATLGPTTSTQQRTTTY